VFHLSVSWFIMPMRLVPAVVMPPAMAVVHEQMHQRAGQE
jgi:hypothetical protein